MDKEDVFSIKVVITVELGRKKIPIKDIIGMATGSIIELDTLVDAPLKFYANGKLIGTCRIVQKINPDKTPGKFGMEVVEIFTQEKRNSLK